MINYRFSMFDLCVSMQSLVVSIAGLADAA